MRAQALGGGKAGPDPGEAAFVAYRADPGAWSGGSEAWVSGRGLSQPTQPAGARSGPRPARALNGALSTAMPKGPGARRGAA